MKKLLLLLAVPLIGASCMANQTARVDNNTNQSNANVQTQAQGRAVFSVTDAAADLQGVSKVSLAINKVEVHSTTQGWVTVSNEAKEFDLLKLKNSAQAELLTDAKLPAGTYDQVQLQVDHVTIAQANNEYEAKLPSNMLKLVGKVVVESDSTSSVQLDFQLDKSLHQSGNGQFILTPVVRLDSRSNAQVDVSANNSVVIRGGTIEANATIGMDENGEMKANFVLDGSVKLNLISNGVIHVTSSGQSETKVKISADQAVSKAKQDGNLDMALSVKLETRSNKPTWHVVGTRKLLPYDVYIDATTGAVISN